MARVQLLLCFTIIFASVTLLDVVSAHLKIKPALPQIEDPKTVKDVEPYTVKVVMVFVSDLEKECPKTSKFKVFFEKLRAYAKYVCPIQKIGQKDYDRDMKAKAGGLFQTIASFAVGKIKKEIQEEKMEAINTFKWMKSVAGKIMGGRKKEESEESMKLTAEQQKEIKEGILRWETVIAKITNTMVLSISNSSSGDDSTSVKKSSSGNSQRTSSGSSFQDTTGSRSNLGSPSGSPSNSPSSSNLGAAGGSKTSYTNTVGGNYISPSGSPMNNPSGSTSGGSGSSAKGGSSSSTTKTSTSTSNGSVGASQSNAITVTEVEAETSKEVMTFIMNLEKKCPQKEEYKVFFEKLKGTMTASSKVSSEKRKGFFSGIKSAAGKLSDAMSFILSRIGSKSAEVKKSMETYKAEVMKTIQELDAIHSQIMSQNQGKKDGSLTVTTTQQTEIKQTITKWEQVTTQFVETAIQSESSSTTSSSSLGKIKPN